MDTGSQVYTYPTDGDYVYDAQEVYTIKEFYDKFQTSLPQWVIVLGGNYGYTDIYTFSGKQVFRIQTTCNQSRVVARDTAEATTSNVDTHISIPENFRHSFCVVQSRNKCSEKQPLSEIAMTRRFPIYVQMIADNKDHCVGSYKLSGLNLILLGKYRENYLLANGVDDKGALDPLIVTIPLDVPDVSFAIIKGQKGMSAKQWKEYTENIDHQSKSFKFDRTGGNKDMSVLSTLTFQHIAMKWEDSMSLERRNRPAVGRSLSEGVPVCNPKENSDEEDSNYEPVDEVRRNRPPVGRSDSEGIDVCDPTESSDEENSNYEPVDQVSCTAYSSFSLSKSLATNKSKTLPPVVAPKTKKSPSTTTPMTAPSLPPRPTIPASDHSVKNIKLFDRDMSNAGAEPLMDVGCSPPVPPRKDVDTARYTKFPTEHSEHKGMMSKIKKGFSKAFHQSAGSRSRSKSDSSMEHGDTDLADTAHNKIVKGIVEDDSGSSCGSIQSFEREYRETLKTHTISEIASSLKKLNLGRHIPTFKKEQIDGTLLIGIVDSEILKDDFGFSPVELFRLRNFVDKGHIPI